MLIVAVCRMPLPVYHIDYDDDAHRFDCDMIELNHRYDNLADHCYDQYFLWEWNDKTCRFQVCDRIWMDHAGTLEKIDGRWRLRVNLYGRRYWVYARQFRETKTQYDPGQADEVYLRKELRRRLLTYWDLMLEEIQWPRW